MRRRHIALLASVVSIAVPAAAHAVELPESGTIDLRTDADARLTGLAPNSETGWDVSDAGDVNGDGVPDMLIGRNANEGERGAAFVVFGSRDLAGRVDLANLGARGFRIDGAQPGDRAGFSVSSLGDVNGDGRADVLVGAGRTEALERLDPGVAYVVFGKADGATVDLAALGGGGYRIIGSSPGELAGFSVSKVGDLNGDGRPEAVIGAPRRDVNSERVNGGSAYVVFGKADTGDVDLAALGGRGFRIDGTESGFAGWSVASSPDMNGDGLPEVLVGAPQTSPDGPESGTGYVVFGKSSTSTVDLGALGGAGFAITGSQGRGITGEQEGLDEEDEGTTGDVRGDMLGEHAGSTVAGVGDVSGDGRPDVAVSAWRADRGSRRDSGSVYIVYGRASSDRVELETLDPANGFRIDGASRLDRTGTSVDAIGDFNLDGRGDLLVSAPLADPFSRRNGGANYIVFGREQNESVDLASLGENGIRIASAGKGDVTSRAASGIGDVNGDGGVDILLGSVHANAGCDAPDSEHPCNEAPRDPGEEAPEPVGPRTGAAYVLYGPRPAPPEPVDPGQQEEEQLDQCFAARNVQVILDDSGSMSETDPERLRGNALQILLSKPRNEREVLGALEFGSTARQLFAPQKIDDENREPLQDLVEERTRANNGGTDYNAAFAIAADENPGAQARIFLTDGMHNEDEYAGGHAGGPPTYVIGLGIGSEGADAERLQRIANDTGGRYFPSVDDRKLQRVLNRIDSRLNCDVDFEGFGDLLTDDDPEEEFEEELEDETHSSDVVLNWNDEEDELDVEEIEYMRAGRVVARISGRQLNRASRGRRVSSGGLRATGDAGDTFQSFRVSGLREGMLRVTVRGDELKGRSRAKLSISESRRRT